MTWTQAMLVIAPVAASIATLIISQRYSRQVARDEVAARAGEAAADRSFRARENRYIDRRDAIIGMIVAAEDEVARIQAWESSREFGNLAPGDVHEDYPFTALNSAFANLVILAEPEVGQTARVLREAVYDYFYGKTGAWSRYDAALRDFQEAARTMLGVE